MDHPEIRQVAALEQEIENYRGTVEALEARLADVKEERDHSQDRYLSHRAQYERICDGLRAALRAQNDLALERLRRAERYRSRLARVLRVEAEEMGRLWESGPALDECFDWMTHRGGAWSRRSRRALDKKGEMK